MLNRLTVSGQKVVITNYKAGKPISFSIEGISSILPEEMFNIAFPKVDEVNLAGSLIPYREDCPNDVSFIVRNDRRVSVTKNISHGDILETNSLWDFARGLAKAIIEKMKEAGHSFATVTLSSEVLIKFNECEHPHLSINIEIN